jgi:hypothetical protein
MEGKNTMMKEKWVFKSWCCTLGNLRLAEEYRSLSGRVKGEFSMGRFMGPRRLLSTLSEEEAFEWPPPRRTLCPNYGECLDYAIGHFWISFTCRGCPIEELILQGKIKELPPPEGESLGTTWDYPLILHEPPAYLLS